MLPLTEARWLPSKILFGHAPPREQPTHRGAFRVESAPPIERPRTPTQTPCYISTEDKVEGEDDGQWLCLPKLAGKRLDVKLVGLHKLPRGVSDTMLALEGTFCHLLLTTAVNKGQKTVGVWGAGKTFRRFSIDRTLVVIGYDIKLDGDRVGQYALTIPGSQLHGNVALGDNVVAVKFETGVVGHFPESSLCMAKNERIMIQDGVFDKTIFSSATLT
ncbi:hypothetical protein B0H12DRAFT_1246997 [Mycena haematopus]|nr:hypothetical protein B0H12DRAFT_1246997 [Mycena haematopus]